MATSGTVRALAETNADSVTAAVNSLSAALRRVDRQVESLDSLTVTLTALSADLDAALTSDAGTLGLLLTDPSLYYNANAVAASLQQILQDFQADPSRYLKDLDIVRVF